LANLNSKVLGRSKPSCSITK